MAVLVGYPMPDRIARVLEQPHAPRHHVEFEHRRQGMGADVAVDLNPGHHLVRTQALIGLDEHGIGRPGIPVDDPVLELPLRF